MANGDNFSDFLTNSDWGSMIRAYLPHQAEYYSSPVGQGFTRTGTGAYSPRKGRYFQQAYQDVYSDYLGEIGTALRQGEAPTTFDQFLQTDPWTRRYSRLPQYERGVTKTYSDPRTRFIYY